LGGTFYSSEKDMEERVRKVEEQVNRIERREDRKSQMLSMPMDLWLDSGFEEGGVLVIHGDPTIRRRFTNRLRRRGYKAIAAADEQEAMSAFRKASYSVMVVPWVIFEKSGDFVGLLRKAFPQTKIIITSPNFAWSNENIIQARHGKEALDAGAYSYVPDQHIERTILTCVESAMKSREKACPVLIKGLPCNLLCTI